VIQRSLGPGAPNVSAIGYGGMHLSLRDRPSGDQAEAVLHAVLDAGVTLLDTADVYSMDQHDIGHNERLIAGALRSWHGNGDGVIVATKGGLVRPGGRWETDGRPEQLHAACDRSLRALGVDRIDLYQLHAPDPQVPLEESVGAMADLEREGKVRWIGLSNVSVDEIERARSVAPILTVQNRLNPFFREAINSGVVAHCTRHGLGFLAYSPTGGGRLNLKLPDHPLLAPMARRLGASPHAIVLAWVMSKSATIIPIPSARQVEHAMESVTAAGWKMSEEELEAIDEEELSRA